MRTAVEDVVNPMRTRNQLEGRGPLGTQTSFRDRRVGIAFDVRDLSVLYVNALPAADRAVRTDGLDDAIEGRCAGRQSLGTCGRCNCTECERVFIRDLA